MSLLTSLTPGMKHVQYMYRVLFFKQQTFRTRPDKQNKSHNAPVKNMQRLKMRQSWKRSKSHRGGSPRSTYPYVVPSGIHLRFESQFALNPHLQLLLFLDSDLIDERKLDYEDFFGRSQQFKSELSGCLSCKAQDGTRVRTRLSLTSRHLSVQHSYREDYCHSNNRPTPPNMHLPPCTPAAHTRTDNTAVHARRAEGEHGQ